MPKIEQKFDAMIVWMSDTAMVPGKQYLVKHTTKTVPGVIKDLQYEVNVNTMKSEPATSLGLNRIGRVNISLNQPIAFDRYRNNKSTGAFIVIDRLTNGTVAAGMILDKRTNDNTGAWWDESPASETLTREVSEVTAEERETGRATKVLDGQNVRMGLNRDLNFSTDGRSENVRRVAEVARLFNRAGLISLISLVSPREIDRQRAGEVIGKENFFVVHLSAPAELAASRNESAKKLAPEDMAESAVDYEDPENADLVLDTSTLSPQDCIAKVIQMLDGKKLI